jgi:uncharacterized membrane protein YccF (DUF307 family)
MGTLLRATWFVFIGWWLGIVWFLLSLMLMLSIVFFPIGVYTITKTYHVMTLKTSPTVVIQDARTEQA